MKKSEFCKQEKKDGTAVRRNPTDAALIRPRWSTSSRWEQHKHGSRSKLFKRECNRTLEVLHQVPTHYGAHTDDNEYEEAQRQRAASRQVGQPAPGAATKGFRLVLFLTLLPWLQK